MEDFDLFFMLKLFESRTSWQAIRASSFSPVSFQQLILPSNVPRYPLSRPNRSRIP
jgi:hypothetical protein